MRRLNCVFLTACLALAGLPCALALPSDKDQPIAIEADSLDVDEAKGISTYKGNVKLTQGSIVLLADIIVAHVKNNELNKIEAVGGPVKFRQQLDEQGQEMRGESQRLEYLADKQTLVLMGAAHLWHEADEFSGNLIEYDTARAYVKASKAESGQGRVQVILQPRQPKK